MMQQLLFRGDQVLDTVLVVQSFLQDFRFQLIPGRGDNGSLVVQLPQQVHTLCQDGFVDVGGSAQHDGIGILYLILKEFTEVFAVLFGLLGIYYGDAGVQLDVRLFRDAGDGLFHVGELADAGGLDQDALGVELLHHLAQGHGKITHQAAADAAGVHLSDLNAGLPQESAVNADLAEFIFDQNDLFSLEHFFQQFLDEGGLACSQESADHINFSHFTPQFLKLSIYSVHRLPLVSLGSFRLPRGERLIGPTLGPSGMQERLNCCLKKRS